MEQKAETLFRVYSQMLMDPGHAGCVFFPAAEHDMDAHALSLSFDLDTAIQALAERLGRDDPETVKLTGIYHT